MLGYCDTVKEKGRKKEADVGGNYKARGVIVVRGESEFDGRGQ